MASVEIRRSASGLRDAARKYGVFIDDANVGTLKRVEVAKFAVAHGSHVVQVGIDWKRSEHFEILATGDEVFRFRCGPRRGSFWIVDIFRRADGGWLTLELDK